MLFITPLSTIYLLNEFSEKILKRQIKFIKFHYVTSTLNFVLSIHLHFLEFIIRTH